MKKLIRIAVLTAVAPLAIPAFAADEVAAYWQVATKTWGEFAEPTNWKIGDPSSGAAGVPGVANYIWITATKGEVKTLMFDMGGGTYTVGGMSTLNTTADSTGVNGYGTTLSVTNGTLNLQSHVCGRLSFTLWNGATVRHSGDHRRGWGGGDPLITVHEGARFEELGKCQFQSYRVVVDAGGTYVLNPSAFGVYYKSANLGNGFTNRGRFEAPNGIDVTYTSDSETSREDGRTTFRNEGNGVFLLGGNVESTTQTTQAYYYEFVGGTLEASNDRAACGRGAPPESVGAGGATTLRPHLGSALTECAGRGMPPPLAEPASRGGLHGDGLAPDGNLAIAERGEDAARWPYATAGEVA